jgi:predicted alpha-1,6-mannanase (GH76 family)
MSDSNAYAQYAGKAIEVLLASLRPIGDLTNMWGSGWWNKAITLQALVDYMNASGSTAYMNVVASVGSAYGNFIPYVQPGFYDDEGWWALAWMSAYELSVKLGQPQEQYLTFAVNLFNDISGGWDDTCNGGIWFKRQPATPNSKDAIQNEEYLELACRLYLNSPTTTSYLNAAQNTWTWFKNSGMINGRNLVNNGLDASCNPTQNHIWTYTQGVLIGALASLYRATKEQDLLRQATLIADAAIATLCYPDGVLSDPCEASGTCDQDQQQFKGIFMQYLAQLWSTVSDESAKQRYAAFIKLSADALWSNYGSGGQFGLVWNGGSTDFNGTVQTSAIQAFNAALVASC